MGRPKGSRNEGYEEERQRLARLVLARLSEPDGPRASFREFARACDVTPPTLRHYFGDWDGAVEAALVVSRGDGEEYLEMTRAAELGDAATALATLLNMTVMAWQRFGVGEVMRAGLEVGLGHERLGPSYIDEMLEPMLQAFEVRIALHIERGELREVDPRYAALALLSPIIMALLHQRELGGAGCRPLDVEALTRTHLESFLAMWGA